MNKKALIFVTILAIEISLVVVTVASTVQAEEKSHKGNNGKCRQLQKDFPPDIQDFQGCHDTFTGKGHNAPEPLP